MNKKSVLGDNTSLPLKYDGGNHADIRFRRLSLHKNVSIVT